MLRVEFPSLHMLASAAVLVLEQKFKRNVALHVCSSTPYFVYVKSFMLIR